MRGLRREAQPTALRPQSEEVMSAVIPHPHRAVDWQAVAIFLAGVMVEEHPGWTPLILQLIDDNTTTPAPPAERNTAP